MEYYLIKGLKSVGPYSERLIHSSLQEKTIDPESLIWHSCLTEWVQIYTLPEFLPSIEQPPLLSFKIPAVVPPPIPQKNVRLSLSSASYPTVPTFTQQSILKMVGFSIITAGISVAFWYINFHTAINMLKSDKRLPPAAVLLFFFFGIGYFVFAFSGFVFDSEFFTGISYLSTAITAVTGVFCAFRTKTILEDNLKALTRRSVSWSTPGTFFFNAFYLQHKINESVIQYGTFPSPAKTSKNWDPEDDLKKKVFAFGKTALPFIGAAIAFGLVQIGQNIAANKVRRSFGLNASANRDSIVNELFDMNNDGEIDTAVLDTDGDGIADTVALDTNGDGKIDTVGGDTDGDGNIDTIATDLNGDGKVENAAFDTNNDGDLDTVIVDDDSDGKFDVVGVDVDNDGDIDVAENIVDEETV